jgi:hypothetical protein
MNNPQERSHELRRLLTELCDGVLGDDDCKLLEQLLVSDSAARTFYRRYLELHGMLQFEEQASSGSTECVTPRSAEEFLEYVRRTSRQESWQDECVAEVTSRSKLPIVPDMDADYPGRAAAQPPENPGLGGTSIQAFGAATFFLRPWTVLGLIVLSAALGAGAAWQLGARQSIDDGIATAQPGSSGELRKSGSPSVAATLIKVTNCRWDPGRSTADVVGGTVRPGQSLNLLEGVAEISTELPSGGRGQFQLEGPLSMILTSQGMPNLQYGKMTAEITCDFDRYSLDTPMGRVVVPYAARIGLIANADDLELHVFDGEAVFEPLWRIADEEVFSATETAEQVIVSAGHSIGIGASESTDIRRGKANRALFASQVSMSDNELHISKKYVAAIRKAAPVCYWRFEGEDQHQVRNEMKDKLHCRVMGDGARWRSYPGNRTIELGSSSEVSYLVTDDPVDGLIENDYTLEVWLKPSHSHRGAVFSLVEEPKLPTQQVVGSGLLLELTGPSFSWSSLYPGRLRFLHRTPPSEFKGTSAYSATAYKPREWQHVVALKEGAAMRLYLNTELVASGADSTKLANGMKVLIGQLYPLDERRQAVVRPMIGELDEVALYNRALSERELNEHYRLVRPESSDSSIENSDGETKRGARGRNRIVPIGSLLPALSKSGNPQN